MSKQDKHSDKKHAESKTKRVEDKETRIQDTLLRLATPGMSAKDLLRETRKQHPKASKKEIVHAAFASLISVADSDGEKALTLQDFALKERASGDLE